MSRFIRWASNALLGNALGKMTVIPTGLRGIDLFVPLPAGGDILLTGDPRAGARVLGNELVYRMANLPEQPTIPLVFFDPNLPQFDAARQELIEGVPKLGTIHTLTRIHADDVVGRVEGRCDYIFAFSTDQHFVDTFRQAITELRTTDKRYSGVTAIMVSETVDLANVSSKIFCAREIAAEGLYPAIDVRRSFSTCTYPPGISTHDQQAIDSARTKLGQLVEQLVPGALADPNWVGNVDPSQRIVAQLWCWLSQSFFVAIPYTGLPASRIPLQVMLREMNAILANQLPEVAPKQLRYVESLNPFLPAR